MSNENRLVKLKHTHQALCILQMIHFVGRCQMYSMIILYRPIIHVSKVSLYYEATKLVLQKQGALRTLQFQEPLASKVVNLFELDLG